MYGLWLLLIALSMKTEGYFLTAFIIQVCFFCHQPVVQLSGCSSINQNKKCGDLAI